LLHRTWLAMTAGLIALAASQAGDFRREIEVLVSLG